jgi:hypothetical protein
MGKALGYNKEVPPSYNYNFKTVLIHPPTLAPV